MIVPIDLHDDGMREFNRGVIKVGRTIAPFVSFRNPELIAATIGERRRRQIIRAENVRQFA